MNNENLKGKCKCICKASCHPYRQKLQVEFREDNGTEVERCIFYKYLIDHYKKGERHN